MPQPVVTAAASPAVVATATPLAALHPAPWNPRTIREPRFKALCASLQADPEFLWRRPILAQLDGTILAGNMRYRAAQHLGWATVPAIMEDVSDQLAKERAIRDNNPSGEWQEDELAQMVYELGEGGADLSALAFDEGELARLLATVSGDGPTAPAEFGEYGDDIKTDYCCPKCGYTWSGKPA